MAHLLLLDFLRLLRPILLVLQDLVQLVAAQVVTRPDFLEVDQLGLLEGLEVEYVTQYFVQYRVRPVDSVRVRVCVTCRPLHALHCHVSAVPAPETNPDTAAPAPRSAVPVIRPVVLPSAPAAEIVCDPSHSNISVSTAVFSPVPYAEI